MDEVDRAKQNLLAEQIVGAIYEVARILGAGFLEKVYERALVVELRNRGLGAEPQVPIGIRYKEAEIGTYFADILVEGCIIIELKCAQVLGKEHIAQCINYLRATNLHLAILVNFQHPKVEWRRLVHDF